MQAELLHQGTSIDAVTAEQLDTKTCRHGPVEENYMRWHDDMRWHDVGNNPARRHPWEGGAR
jgi:hypothetical protein